MTTTGCVGSELHGLADVVLDQVSHGAEDATVL